MPPARCPPVPAVGTPPLSPHLGIPGLAPTCACGGHSSPEPPARCPPEPWVGTPPLSPGGPGTLSLGVLRLCSQQLPVRQKPPQLPEAWGSSNPGLPWPQSMKAQKWARGPVQVPERSVSFHRTLPKHVLLQPLTPGTRGRAPSRVQQRRGPPTAHGRVSLGPAGQGRLPHLERPAKGCEALLACDLGLPALEPASGAGMSALLAEHQCL